MRPAFVSPARFLWQWRAGLPSPVSRGGRSGRSSMSGGGGRSTVAPARWATRLLAVLGSILAAEAQVGRCGGSGERSGDAVPADGRRAAKAGPQSVARVLLAGAVLQPGPGGARLWSVGPLSGGRCGARQRHSCVTVRQARSSPRPWAVCRARSTGATTRECWWSR